jgi:hypothetical protein
MAHFAEIDENNKVIRVIVVNNNALDLQNEEESGMTFCKSLYGGNWLQTSYNNNIRKNYAGIGHTYDPVKDAFIAPKPYNSWFLDENTCRWIAPIPYPLDNKRYLWNEENQEWQLYAN